MRLGAKIMNAVPSFLRPYQRNFPPGVDPLTYKLGEVTERLRQTAVFPLFSMPDPASLNTPILGPAGLVGVEVNEKLHRLGIPMTLDARGGVRTDNPVGKKQVAEIQVKWHPVAENYVASPEREPPPVPFDPRRSQRFIMNDGTFRFFDGNRSGFHAFGTGRTLPTIFGGQPVVQLSAVINVTNGFGGFAGHEGTVTVNGTVNPPLFLKLSVMPVIIDFDGSLQTDSEIPPIEPLPDPDPRSTFFIFYGETNPQHPERIVPVQSRMFATSRTRLRLVHVGFEVGERVCSRTTLGKFVGDVHAHFWLGPFDGQFPVPFQSTEGGLYFHDHNSKPVGSLRADIIEGQAFLLDVPGAPMPVFRGAGIAPILEGTGIFHGATGFVSTVALLSLFPRAMSVFYIVRLNDLSRRYSSRYSTAFDVRSRS